VVCIRVNVIAIRCNLRETTSQACRSSRPDLTVSLEAFYHYIPLSLVS
jgi:hypothetical protein